MFTPEYAQRMYEFIMSQLDAGRIVQATNYLTCIRLSAKHREAIRLLGNHVEVRRGKRWDSIIGCKITAH